MTEIIDIVFQMCIQREPNNFSEAVYDRVQFTTQEYFENDFIKALRAAQERSEQSFLVNSQSGGSNAILQWEE